MLSVVERSCCYFPDRFFNIYRADRSGEDVERSFLIKILKCRCAREHYVEVYKCQKYCVDRL